MRKQREIFVSWTPRVELIVSLLIEPFPREFLKAGRYMWGPLKWNNEEIEWLAYYGTHAGLSISLGPWVNLPIKS